MNPSIRRARKSDAEAISALIVGLKSCFLARPDSAEIQPFLATLEPDATAERIASAEFSYYVAENQSGLCGVIAIRDGTHVYHLFVRPDTQRQGIARALWEHARQHSGATTFTVNSSLYAVPVYERLGFKATAEPLTEHGLTFVPMKLETSWQLDDASIGKWKY